MPDIVIRMEMPQRCKACRFCGFGGRRSELNVCMFTGESQPKLSQERMSKCPLVPLPEGHGRLVDLDALINKLQTLRDRSEKDAAFSGNREAGVTWDDAINIIISAPVIVPAEGVGEK